MKTWIASLLAITLTFSNTGWTDAAPPLSDPLPIENEVPIADGEVVPLAESEAIESAAPISTTESQTPNQAGVQEQEPVGEVTKASADAAASAERRRTWQRIGIAVGVVAIATLALIFVSKNPGHNK